MGNIHLAYYDEKSLGKNGNMGAEEFSLAKIVVELIPAQGRKIRQLHFNLPI